MTSSSRSHVASSFTLIKGAMIDETYAVFAAWGRSVFGWERPLRDYAAVDSATATQAPARSRSGKL
jgi:hypothetical protein